MLGQIKQDMNFLEYPVWFQDVRMAEQQEDGCVWRDREGFVYRAGYKPPTRKDYIFLFYMLLRSQQEDWKNELSLSRYEILKDCKMVVNKESYSRLGDSLKRWKMVGLEFQGKFYDGKTYQTINFGIVDAWNVHKKTKRLSVRLSPEWLLKIKHSNFFKMIDFYGVRELRSPLAIRLYEILLKSFQGRDIWETDALKLAKKIPLAEKYASHIVFKIRRALKQIEKYTSLNVSLTVRRPKRGKAILVFQKNLDKAYHDPEETNMPEALTADYRTLLDMVPERFRDKKTIQDAIASALRKYGHERVRRNILYANSEIRDQKKYRAFLGRSLQNDWGLAYTEDLKDEQEDIQKKRAKVKNAEQQEALEALETKKIEEKLSTLTDSQKESLTNDFLESIKDNSFLMRFYRKEGLKNRTLKKLLEGYFADTLLSENDLKLPLETGLADTDLPATAHPGICQ
jgi:predicted house-cleaning noncanonical NTP pyrophosphatase (MazG superfamily)